MPHLSGLWGTALRTRLYEMTYSEVPEVLRIARGYRLNRGYDSIGEGEERAERRFDGEAHDTPASVPSGCPHSVPFKVCVSLSGADFQTRLWVKNQVLHYQSIVSIFAAMACKTLLSLFS